MIFFVQEMKKFKEDGLKEPEEAHEEEEDPITDEDP
jgi:hypothetical protein